MSTPPIPGPLRHSAPGAPLRVAIIAESFLPQTNGVTNSVCRIADSLEALGHRVLILAPGSGPTRYRGIPVVRLPAVPMPGYRSFALGLPSRRLLTTALRSFAPDVVHLASPALLGSCAVEVARRWALPTVAVFQTDLVGFASQYGLPAARVLWPALRRLHAAVDRTLVPSTDTLRTLREQGFPRLSLWGRGVDTERFHPRHRDAQLRAELSPEGAPIVGYVGRLAREKRVDWLAHLARLRGLRLVVVGDGPDRARLRRLLPDAVFTGELGGTDLSRMYAALDVFVHTGAHETFCQTIQEALASGVPVLAPDRGGPLDLVRAEDNGLLFDAQSVRDLRAAAGRLIHNAQLRERLAASARPSVLHRTWSAINAELVDHYRAAITPASTPAPAVPTQGIPQ
jgi:phosphatidylinositol alpha 1,6-mannosyltransferase